MSGVSDLQLNYAVSNSINYLSLSYERQVYEKLMASIGCIEMPITFATSARKL